MSETLIDKLTALDERPSPVEWWKTTVELAEQFGLSVSAVRARIRRLRALGVPVEERKVVNKRSGGHLIYFNIHSPLGGE